MRAIRDGVLLLLGTGLFVDDVWVNPPISLTTLGFAVGLIAGPAALRADEKRRSDRECR